MLLGLVSSPARRHNATMYSLGALVRERRSRLGYNGDFLHEVMRAAFPGDELADTGT